MPCKILIKLKWVVGEWFDGKKVMGWVPQVAGHGGAGRRVANPAQRGYKLYRAGALSFLGSKELAIFGCLIAFNKNVILCNIWNLPKSANFFLWRIPRFF